MKRTGRRTAGRTRRLPVPGLTIRRARMSDLGAVVRMSRGVSEIENYPGQRMKVADFVHFVKPGGGLMLVAEVNGRVVGYITVYQSENYFFLPYSVVRKDWRKRGVGGALLESVETLAKKENVEYILTSAYLYNRSVRSFLKTRGYISSKQLVQYSKLISKKKR